MLVRSITVVSNPKPGDTCPERTGELRQRMKEAVVDYLIHRAAQNTDKDKQQAEEECVH